MKVLVKNNDDAIFVCGSLQRIINRIKDLDLYDVEKAGFVTALSVIRDSVEVEGVQDAGCVNPPKTDGVARIEEERRRQIEEEGFSLKHDLERNAHGECARAAACYALPMEIRSSFFSLGMGHLLWPWATKRFKPIPKDRIRELEKAGALVAAEIDRLLALEEANYGV
jgi:hypothetical protein